MLHKSRCRGSAQHLLRDYRSVYNDSSHPLSIFPWYVQNFYSVKKTQLHDNTRLSSKHIPPREKTKLQTHGSHLAKQPNSPPKQIHNLVIPTYSTQSHDLPLRNLCLHLGPVPSAILLLAALILAVCIAAPARILAARRAFSALTASRLLVRSSSPSLPPNIALSKSLSSSPSISCRSLSMS